MRDDLPADCDSTSPDAAAWRSPVRLSANDHDAVWRLHERLHALQPRPGLFARETPEFFAACLHEDASRAGGQMFGVRRDGRLLAYGVLGLPRSGETHFGCLVGLPAGRHAEVAQVDGAGVDPLARGLGLQRRLISHRLRAARAVGRALVFSTAAPDNAASLRNLLASGFVIVGLRRLFGGHDRYVLFHAPSLATRARALPAPKLLLVAADNLPVQRALLDEGLVGIGPATPPRGDAPMAAFAPAGTVSLPWSGTVPAS